MIKNFLITAFRNIVKRKGFSFINIFSLAMGFAFTILVLMIIQYDLGYDKHHKNYKRIYRYGVNMTIGGRNSTQATCSLSAAPLLKREMPKIESFVRFLGMGDLFIRYRDNLPLKEQQVWVTDASVFDIFTHTFIAGNQKTSLKEPYSIVLTRNLAEKIFPPGVGVGEVLDIPGQGLYTVTGIIEDLPKNSHLQFSALISLSTLLKKNNINPSQLLNPRTLGSGMVFFTYFLFQDGFSSKAFDEGFKIFYDRYLNKIDRIQYKGVVEPLSDIYLNSTIWNEFSRRNRNFLMIFSLIGFFILLLACFNYVNMSTSRFSQRTREIGIKKAIGARKRQLTLQFLGESLFMALISLVLGFVMVFMILKWTPFTQLMEKALIFSPLHTLNIILISLIIAFFTGLLSGIYPAIILSRVSPVNIFRSRQPRLQGKIRLRNILVIIQFSIAIGIFIVTLLMGNQLDYLLTHDLGFNQENIIHLSSDDLQVRKKLPAFRQAVLSYQGVVSAGFSNATPLEGIRGYARKWEQEGGVMELHAFQNMRIDENYLQTMGIDILEGRNFDSASSNSKNVLVNQALVKTFKWKNPIGKRMGTEGRVIGVFKDFNYNSLHIEVHPMYIEYARGHPAYLTLKIAKNGFYSTVDFIKVKWKEMMAHYPLNLSFLDAGLERRYRNDIRQMKLTRLFSMVSILICCLGLLGLISFSTEQKTKEIAIRKVLGASIIEIIYTLFKPIFWLIFLALIIATPVAYWFSLKWLSGFAYQTPISLMIFILSGMVALVLAFITTGYHSWRAAVSKPADTLKYE